MLTWYAGESGLQVRHEVPLARMDINKVAKTDLTRASTRAEAVKVDKDVFAAANVEVIADTPAQPHPPVHR